MFIGFRLLINCCTKQYISLRFFRPGKNILFPVLHGRAEITKHTRLGVFLILLQKWEYRLSWGLTISAMNQQSSAVLNQYSNIAIPYLAHFLFSAGLFAGRCTNLTYLYSLCQIIKAILLFSVDRFWYGGYRKL